jgi:hypothetical protein
MNNLALGMLLLVAVPSIKAQDKPRQIMVYLELIVPPLATYRGIRPAQKDVEEFNDLVALQHFNFSRLLTKVWGDIDLQVTDNLAGAQYKLTLNMPGRQYAQAQWTLTTADVKVFIESDRFYPTDREDFLQAMIGIVKALGNHAGVTPKMNKETPQEKSEIPKNTKKTTQKTI